MGDHERADIKAAFNDSAAKVRLLIATDAASEGLNLQETARFLLHWDIPWNPARLEQRNGRLDRHGQARDVTVHHFATEDDQDLAFLAHVIGKLETIRDDIGATGELFERAFERRFVQGEDVEDLEKELKLGINEAQKRVEIPRDTQILPQNDDTLASRARLAAFAAELDLTPATLRQTLETAMAFGFASLSFVTTVAPRGSASPLKFRRLGRVSWTIQCGRRKPAACPRLLSIPPSSSRPWTMVARSSAPSETPSCCIWRTRSFTRRSPRLPGSGSRMEHANAGLCAVEACHRIRTPCCC